MFGWFFGGIFLGKKPQTLYIVLPYYMMNTKMWEKGVVLAVSRYHQTETFFSVEDTPDHPDCDLSVPRYHLIPSGCMRIIAPIDISPSNECILEPSWNDYTVASHDDDSPHQTINVDDIDETNVLSHSDSAVIDLIDGSDSDLPADCFQPIWGWVCFISQTWTCFISSHFITFT